MRLIGKKLALFLADLYEEREFWYPYYRMQEEGASIVVVGAKLGSHRGKHGLPATVDRAIDDVSAADFDGLIIPGGYAPDHMRRNSEMVGFTRDIHQRGKLVAAICHAGWMLVSAGLLRGRRATSYAAIRDDMVNAGAEWVDEPVVEDGLIITSRHPGDLPEFCRAIIDSLSAS